MSKSLRRSKKKRVLVLNADCTPLALIDWKRAIVLTIINQSDPTKGFEVMDYYDSSVLSCGHKKFMLPSVVRIPFYIKPKGRKVPFSRKNVFIRDQMTCMYCGMQDMTGKELTFDHIIPRAIWNNQNHNGTPTTWKNIVTCCKHCNRKKANRTPKQANMKLLKEPKEPGTHEYILGLGPWTKIHKSWEPYLPKFYKNLLKREEDA